MRILITLFSAVAMLTPILAWSAPSSTETHPMPAGHVMAHAPNARGAGAAMPQEPGQEMFGTVAEVIRILESSPDTDWSRVNIDALRKHLIDMNEVALNAQARSTQIPGGLRIRVTGTGRTTDAIHRMLAMHARTMDGRFGWRVAAQPIQAGDILTVTSDDPSQTVRIRALGFMGVMVYGTHHGMHHLAIARGDMPY